MFGEHSIMLATATGKLVFSVESTESHSYRIVLNEETPSAVADGVLANALFGL